MKVKSIMLAQLTINLPK